MHGTFLIVKDTKYLDSYREKIDADDLFESVYESMGVDYIGEETVDQEDLQLEYECLKEEFSPYADIDFDANGKMLVKIDFHRLEDLDTNITFKDLMEKKYSYPIYDEQGGVYFSIIDWLCHEVYNSKFFKKRENTTYIVDQIFDCHC